MTLYIDKSAVVAEIERRIQFFIEVSGDANSDIVITLLRLKSFLDTLGVKEVDLDGEINLWVRNLHRVPNFEELNKFARHFFELGLQKAQKGE